MSTLPTATHSSTNHSISLQFLDQTIGAIDAISFNMLTPANLVTPVIKTRRKVRSLRLRHGCSTKQSQWLAILHSVRSKSDKMRKKFTYDALLDPRIRSRSYKTRKLTATFKNTHNAARTATVQQYTCTEDCRTTSSTMMEKGKFQQCPSEMFSPFTALRVCSNVKLYTRFNTWTTVNAQSQESENIHITTSRPSNTAQLMTTPVRLMQSTSYTSASSYAKINNELTTNGKLSPHDVQDHLNTEFKLRHEKKKYFSIYDQIEGVKFANCHRRTYKLNDWKQWYRVKQTQVGVSPVDQNVSISEMNYNRLTETFKFSKSSQELC